MPPIDSAPLLLAAFAALGYLLGSIPFGIVITKAFGLGDLRKIGSGKPGPITLKLLDKFHERVKTDGYQVYK